MNVRGEQKVSDNYFVTRANTFEGNVRLYRVVNGDCQQFACADSMVASGQALRT